MSTEPPSAYDLLDVSHDAREEEINKAFRQRSLIKAHLIGQSGQSRSR